MKFLLNIVIILALGISNCKAECVQEEFSTESSPNQENLFGGITPIKVDNLNSESNLIIVNNAALLYNLNNTLLENYHRITCIKSGATQIVSGVKYIFNVILTETKCEKQALLESSGSDESELIELGEELANEIENCELTQNENNCKIEIIHQPWLESKYRLQSFECSN